MNIIPVIGTKGVWSANAPFNTKLLSRVIYTCVSQRTFSDMIAKGEDPQALYYTANGLDAATYQTDVAAGAVALTLQAPDNSTVVVPSTYLASYPDGNGVAYHVMAIAIKLTALPDTLDLSALLAKLESDCVNMIGVTATAQAVSISNATLINATDNAATEAARKALITDNTTDYARLQLANTQLAAYMQRCTELEQYILSLSTTPTPTT